ncbi:MAG: hypothetical protein MUE54_10725 [Anaerolineae bacterium]|jgi:hypothetical protein|nr:hypothetical protein [Anaerolineae bacterium]
MPLVQIDMTPEQRQSLKAFAKKLGIKNVSEYIRGLIRADMEGYSIEFPPDVEWGGKRVSQKEAQYRSDKQTLLGDLLERLNEAIPVPVSDMTTTTANHLQALIEDFEGRQVLPDLLIVVKEAQTILNSEGYIALMRWFGIVPLVDAKTQTRITAKRILSADTDE